ncbi:MAG: hypothetical protein JWP34_4702 [Massilia sp.]|nr:hypothetical protein [Massilia sp.]
MNTAGFVFTAIGTLAGIAGAYFAWVAVRRPKRHRPPASPAVTAAAGSGTPGTGPTPYDVFVSYSHQDADWVTAFAERLEGEGIRVAYDQVFLRPGDPLVHAIEQAIMDSTHGLLVYSPDSVASGWVDEEYRTLITRSIQTKNNQRFIPVVIQDAQLSLFAQNRYYLDFRNVSGAEYDRLVVELVKVLRP